MNEKKCVECGETKGLKRGWTNAWYCSAYCEISGVSRVHATMPGAGGLPRPRWVPYHIEREIRSRWEEK